MTEASVIQSIMLGEKFSSFESLKDAIDRYQRDNHVQLIVKDSKLLGRIAKTMPKLMEVVNKDIIYYRLSYACEYHGEFKARGKSRPKHLSKRRGCPMRILLRLAEDLCHLVVYELYEQHNHPIEPKEMTKTPRQQMFRLSRTNPTRYTLAKIEEGENGQLLETETTYGTQVFDDQEDTNEASSSKAESSSTPVARLIGNGTKRIITAGDITASHSFEDLKRRRIMLQNRKLELEARKLELENKKLELELKNLEKKQEEGESNIDGNTYYVSQVIDDSKEGLTETASTFAPSAAEVIKSLTSRGQPIQIITQ